MPTIGASVSVAMKAAFEAAALSRGTTASRLSASLITAFLREAEPTETVLPKNFPANECRAGRYEAKTRQVYVRMEPRYHDVLTLRAGQRLWPRSTYLANLLRAHIDGGPVLSDLEIDALRQVARQLAAVGRNLNQIARQLNVTPEGVRPVPTLDIATVKTLVELSSTLVKDLVRSNVAGWGVGDF